MENIIMLSIILNNTITNRVSKQYLSHLFNKFLSILLKIKSNNLLKILNNL